MDTNRLSKNMETALNNQMMKEAYASQIYLAYASLTESQGFGGIAHFLFKHSDDKRSHMRKILEYILSRGAGVKISAIPAPPENPISISSCFEIVFELEIGNTKAIYRVVKLSFGEEDWATWNFLQWFVNQQVEEESFAKLMMDKIKIAGGDKINNNTLYTLDRDLRKGSDDVRSFKEVISHIS